MPNGNGRLTYAQHVLQPLRYAVLRLEQELMKLRLIGTLSESETPPIKQSADPAHPHKLGNSLSPEEAASVVDGLKLARREVGRAVSKAIADISKS